MGAHLIDLTGKRFGRLLVLERSENNSYGACWLCQCDCEKICVKPGATLRRGVSTSCGCYAKEIASKSKRTHGKSNTRLFQRWTRMKRRCSPNADAQKRRNYYDRGITVCDEWAHDFLAFERWALDNGYDDSLTIDRIDNDKGYSPNNCRWISNKEQHRNTRRNQMVIVNGSKMCVTVAAEHTDVPADTMYERLRRGVPQDMAASSERYAYGRGRRQKA